MARSYILSLIAVLFAISHVFAADDPVFSGPQIGEKLPPFKAKGVLGDLADKELDLIKQAGDQPLLLIFVHTRTRPVLVLVNALTKFSVSQAEKGLHAGVVFLTDDPTTASQFIKRIKTYFTEGVPLVISHDGPEGPGSYGLNRNVSLTILVANQGKVTANYALVQPSVQADGPKILKSLVDITGGGKVPSIAQLSGRRIKQRPEMKKQARDPNLGPLVRAVINKQASAENVAKTAAEVEKYVAEHAAARRELGQIANRISNSGNLENYGTPAAQDVLRKWAKKYGGPSDKPSGREKQEK